MSGSGNDFIIIDNREHVIADDDKREFTRKVCTPKMSIGADGVIFLEQSDQADFRWDFYNADGSSAEMCGNGGRCVARFASEHKITSSKLSFETLAGVIEAEVDGKSVKVKLTPPQDIRQDLEIDLEGTRYAVDSVNTGVPHAIIFCEDVDHMDVERIGRGIRNHPDFAPAGTNVDFVQVTGPNQLKIRTYERGVEEETLACGTGGVASAIIASLKNRVKHPVQVETRGGEVLRVYFQSSNGSLGDVYLEGLTKTAFEGTIVEI